MRWCTPRVVLALGLMAACGGGDGTGTGPAAPLRIEARTNTQQGALTGTPVGSPPSVRLTRGAAGVTGVVVTFAVVSGDGVITGATPSTDANGVATLGSWKPGRYGVNSLSASVEGATGSPVRFEAIADAGLNPPQAQLTFADSVNVGGASTPHWVPAGIRGDGRAVNGEPLTRGAGGVYQGSFCGSALFIGRGDLFDENSNLYANIARYWTAAMPASCTPARGYLIYADGPEAPPKVMHPLSIAEDIGTMAIGETRIQAYPFQGGSLEGAFIFDDKIPGASKVLITRLPDIRDEMERMARQWRIESRDTHRAAGGTGFLATTYLPFVLTVTEVPYPWPTYP